MRPLVQVDPPPMPGVREARLQVTEARKAIERAEKAWNPSQLRDAIRSARFFIDSAEKCCETVTAIHAAERAQQRNAG